MVARTSRTVAAGALTFASALVSPPGYAETVVLAPVTVDAESGPGGGPGANAPITLDTSIGSHAPPGSASALAPSQAKLSTTEPVAIVSDKSLRDVINPSADYNEALKWTPGFTAGNHNGVGDTLGAWRGFAQGQYNVTFDGIPFGDLVDQHSANYFPASFLGAIVVDRGPGQASQPGYATFGGTLALFSRELTDRPGGSIASYYGNFSTFVTDVNLQSGLLPSGGKFMLGFHHQSSDGVQSFGNQRGDFGIVKIEQPVGDFTVTALSTIGQEAVNNVGFATYAQYQQNGKNAGSLNGNPALNTYFGDNRYTRQSDFEYVDVRGAIGGWHVDNDAYTYAIFYPFLGNAGANLAKDVANPIPTINIPSPTGPSTPFKVIGVNPGDVTGYKKYDNTRAFGDLLNVSHDIDAGWASGTLQTGVWYQHVAYERGQQYYDFTSNEYFSQLGNPLNVSFKQLYGAYVNSVYPFVQYDWRPTASLTITPGYKFEYFSRAHLATVNANTLAMSDYAATDTANLPFLTVRYRLTPNASVYVQASEGMLPPNESAYYVFNTQANQVQPERTENYQSGIVYKSDRLTADADVYLINAQHFASQTTDATGATFFRDNGGAQYKGIEGELTYTLSKGLALYVNGTYNSGHYTSGLDGNNNPHAGLAIGGTPRYTAAGGFLYDDGRTFGSVLARLIGDSFGTQGSDQIYSPASGQALTVNRVPAYESTDLVAGYRTAPIVLAGTPTSLEFKVGVNNLLDSRVVTDIRGVPASNVAATAGLGYEFQPGRLIYAGVKASF